MNLIHFLFDAPISDWLYFCGFFIGIVLMIVIAERIRILFGFSPEVNRKLVHILTGVLIFFVPYFFQSNRPLILIALVFIVVNTIGVKTGKLKALHGTRRASYGTVFYPVTFLILVVTCWENHKVVIILSMLILGLADAAAAIVGENLKHPHDYILGMDKKSIEGSLVMFLSSFLLIFIFLPVVDQLDGLVIDLKSAAWIGFFVAVVATALEGISSYGSDNLSAPLGSAFVLNFMLSRSVEANVQFSIGVGLALLVAFLSFNARFLSANGSVGTFLLAVLVFGVGGWSWSIPILVFFVISSFLSKIGKSYKAQFSGLFEKSSRRDFGQVMANGAIAGIILLLYSFFPHAIWYLLYLGTLAAVTADTWATEIGVFSRIKPRLITTFRKVEPGSSGGITLLGTAAAIAGSLIIVISGLLAYRVTNVFSLRNPLLFWIVVISGVLASLVDSFLGATVQAQHRCPRCHKITEKSKHCQNIQTRVVSDISWINNDVVNVVCAFSGAVFVWIGTKIISNYL